MFRILPIALAQSKSGNPSENVLDEIHQDIYSLYWAKEITKKIYKMMNLKQNGHYIYEFWKKKKHLILIDYYLNIKIK